MVFTATAEGNSETADEKRAPNMGNRDPGGNPWARALNGDENDEQHGGTPRTAVSHKAGDTKTKRPFEGDNMGGLTVRQEPHHGYLVAQAKH